MPAINPVCYRPNTGDDRVSRPITAALKQVRSYHSSGHVHVPALARGRRNYDTKSSGTQFGDFLGRGRSVRR